MSLKCFSKHVQSLMDSDIPCVEIILNYDDYRSITAILCGINFIITATEFYPFVPPIISCINSNGVPVRININTEGTQVCGLTSIIHVLLHEFIPNTNLDDL